MLATPEELRCQFTEDHGAASAAGALLVEMLKALATVENEDNIPGHVRQDVRSQVAELLSLTRGFVAKFERSL